MGRFYQLRVPSNVEGVSTTIDVSMGPINHIAFDGGMLVLLSEIECKMSV